jgi:hypothetical protein
MALPGPDGCLGCDLGQRWAPSIRSTQLTAGVLSGAIDWRWPRER